MAPQSHHGPRSVPASASLHGMGPRHPPWLTALPVEQALVNICQKEIFSDKRAGRLLRVTAKGGLGLSGQEWVLQKAVPMGSRNLAVLVAVLLHPAHGILLK